MKHLLAAACLAALLCGSALAGTTTIDDFESYADTTALVGVWTSGTGWPTLILGTDGGASSTTKYLDINDAGWSMSATASYSAIVPSNGNYRVTFHYMNGQTLNPVGSGTSGVFEFRLTYGGGSQLATVPLTRSPVTTWTQAQTGILSLTAGDNLAIEIYGNTPATLNVRCSFDQIMLEEITSVPLDAVLSPDPREWLGGALNTLTATPSGGSGTYTQVAFDVGDDGSVEYTDSTSGDGFTFDWDTSALGTLTVDVVDVKATVTDSAVTTASDTNTYTVDNRFDGRTQAMSNGSFDAWSGLPLLPDGWVEFQDVANSTPFQEAVDVHSAPYALGVTFTASDYVNRYAMRTVNLHPGTGNDVFTDCIMSFWGKGGSARVFVWTDTTGDGLPDFNTFSNAAADSPAWALAYSAPFDISGTGFFVATHQFLAGNHFYDDVSLTVNQVTQTGVEPGLWNLYH